MKNLYNNSNNFTQNSAIESNLVVCGFYTNKRPKVSILMPIYNHYEYLEQAIMSAVNQETTIDYEIIIVDNNHPDFQATNEEIIKKINSPKIFYYVNEKNIGACGNWNRCVELSKGEYITFCHDDDMLVPNAVSVLLSYVKHANPFCAIIGSNIRINSKGTIISKKMPSITNKFSYRYTDSLLVIGNPTNGCGALYHKDSVMKIGGFNPDFYPCFDYAFNALYGKNFVLVKIPNVTFYYRVSEKSDSSQCYMEIPQISKVIVSNIINSKNHFKFILSKVSQISIRLGENQSKQIWEHKSRKPQILDRICLSLYVRFCTIIGIIQRVSL